MDALRLVSRGVSERVPIAIADSLVNEFDVDSLRRAYADAVKERKRVDRDAAKFERVQRPRKYLDEQLQNEYGDSMLGAFRKDADEELTPEYIAWRAYNNSLRARQDAAVQREEDVLSDAWYFDDRQALASEYYANDQRRSISRGEQDFLARNPFDTRDIRVNLPEYDDLYESIVLSDDDKS
eukprot:jgi/Mesvir1/26548/Mv16203-RA.1